MTHQARPPLAARGGALSHDGGGTACFHSTGAAAEHGAQDATTRHTSTSTAPPAVVAPPSLGPRVGRCRRSTLRIISSPAARISRSSGASSGSSTARPIGLLASHDDSSRCICVEARAACGQRRHYAHGSELSRKRALREMLGAMRTRKAVRDVYFSAGGHLQILHRFFLFVCLLGHQHVPIFRWP
jgi:hypothetical protein